AKLVKILRDRGFWAECDLVGRELRPQLRYADKIGARFNMVLGGDEMESGCAIIKDMRNKDKLYEVSLNENFGENAERILK
ncbi:MAG: histidine--tRNA ligase, partial [Eubacterium sp.]|nr:histidine--tRNA ligase [Eubacterium sp.]